MEASDSDINPSCSEAHTTTADNEQNNGKLTSYGIEISRKKIKSAAVLEQDLALSDLGVSAYEQEDFEEGVLRQVDEAIEEQQIQIEREKLEKDLKNIKDELKTTGEELEKVEKTVSALGGNAASDFYVRKSLESIKVHRDVKISQLQKLLAREASILKSIEGLSEKQDTTQGVATSTVTKRDVLGELNFGIKTFEADDEQEPNQPSSSRDEQDWQANINLQHINEEDKYDRIKAKRRKIDIREEFSDSYSSEEYIPFPDEESDELTDDGEADEFIKKDKRSRLTEARGKRGKKKLGTHHKELVSNLKRNKKQTFKKVVDDGDIKAYNERIRMLRLRERLKDVHGIEADDKEAGSEDELNDKEVISLKRGFSLPVKIWRKLYKYQRTGVKWLWELHCQDVGGIVGDEMGLGKTIQVIAFLTGLKRLKTGKGCGPSLIACPATVLQQWVKEFHKWSPEFRVAILHETGSYSGRKAALIKHIVDDKGVLVTSYSNLRIHENELLRYNWDYVILDEGHKIRNPDARITLTCKQFSTPHRLILSGSPLQNNLKELWSLFDFIFPGKLGTLPVFMAEFSVPITIGGYANATDVQVQTAYKCACILRDTISPYLLRRMKKDVNMSIKLPSKNEQVLFCRLTDEQRGLYKKYINSRDVGSILAGSMKVFPGLIMLRKICNHPDLSSAAGSLDWMKAKEDLKSTNRHHGGDLGENDFDQGYGHWKRSGKMIVVESLLKLWKQQNHRVLLFSQTKQMLDIMELFVKQREYTYVRMDGSTSIGSRQPSVDRFNQDKSIFVFLLTTRVGGLGVNLIGADRIVIFDPDWNPSTDTQARERSWRIGQDKHVTIYRLLTTGTIEEKIYHRQIFKQFLTNRVLKNPAQRRFFKSNDLYELFTLGDEKPQQATETGALFAGTGSEVNLRPRKPTDVAKEKAKALAAGAKIAELKRKKMREKAKRISASITKRQTNAQSESEASMNDSDKRLGLMDDVNSQSAILRGSRIDEETGTYLPAVMKKESNKVELNEEPYINKTSSTSASRSGLTNPSIAEKSKRRKKRKRKMEKLEGTEINYLDKHDVFKDEEEESSKSDKKMNKKHDEDILHALFENTGVHSALKHDVIVESGNPDYVLVEKEAERVAKQASEALRKSRALCRNVSVGIPTWTGSHGSAGIPTAKKPRFGIKKSKPTEPTEACKRDAQKGMFDGAHMLESTDTDNNDMSSASLLKRMRARNALQGSSTSTEIDSNLYRINPQNTDSKETELVEEIRQFVALEARNVGMATTQEILERFKPKIADKNNALFKEMLKQICDFQKVNGVGTWFLKETFK